MQPVGRSDEEGLACKKCGRRAAFICPAGALCPTDALLAAARHGWIPTQLRGSGKDTRSDEAPDVSPSIEA